MGLVWIVEQLIRSDSSVTLLLVLMSVFMLHFYDEMGFEYIVRRH